MGDSKLSTAEQKPELSLNLLCGLLYSSDSRTISGRPHRGSQHDLSFTKFQQSAKKNVLTCRMECALRGTEQDHFGRYGIIWTNEQVTFAPFPRDRYPATGHPLPDLPPHRCVPSRDS